jgi:acyl-CoA reductase-like NAD-dependent aldehyde dehydrogenase
MSASPQSIEPRSVRELQLLGDGLEPGTTLGPLQNRAQFDKVQGFLADAHAHGKVIAGGNVVQRAGYFGVEMGQEGLEELTQVRVINQGR